MLARSCARRGGALGRGGPSRGGGRGALSAAGRHRAARAEDGVRLGAASSGSGAETPAADEPCGRQTSSRARARGGAQRPKRARTAERERTALAERAALVRERVRALEQALAEQEGLPPAARALAEDGARLALASLDVEPGAERAVAAALRTRAAAVIADDPAVGLALLQRARAAGLGSLTVLAGRSPQDLVERVSGRPARHAARRHRSVRHARGLRLRPRTRRAVVRGRDGRGRPARAAGPAHGARCRGERRSRQRSRPRPTLRRRGGRARARSQRLRSAGRRGFGPRSIDAATLSRLVDLATALHDGIDAAQRAAGRFEAPLRARVDAGAMRASELGEELRTLGATEVNLRRELEETSAAVTAAEVEIARIDADVADATRRLESAGEVDVGRGRRPRRARRRAPTGSRCAAARSGR